MSVDPGDWIPIIGLAIMGGCMVIGIIGAWAVGRARGIQDAMKNQLREADTHDRIERMERSLEAVSEEIERLGEVQRFALKLVAERSLPSTESGRPSMGRVITPH
jgi:hypothetical protein